MERFLHLTVAGGTYQGNRPRNDDSIAHDQEAGVLAVGDGMSQRPAGDVASKISVQAALDYFKTPETTWPSDLRERMCEAFDMANRRVRERARSAPDLEEMATTLACVVDQHELLIIAHLGDSRVLRFRDDRLERLTTDHRLGNDETMRGRFSREQVDALGPKGLTRAIGLRDSVGALVEVRLERLLAEDILLVTTAGLTDVVPEERISAIVRTFRQPRAIVSRLLDLAVQAGDPDNMSCVVGRWRSVTFTARDE